jgi:uncharacterized protein YciI
MEFLVLGRGVPAPDDGDSTTLDEEHWAYMDRFTFSLRGPLLTPDRTRWAGSVHVVEVPDLAAARAFAEQDPYHRAGSFVGVDIWRVERLDTTSPEAAPTDGLQLVIVGGEDEDGLLSALNGRVAWWARLFTADDGVRAGTAVVTWGGDTDDVTRSLQGVADVREAHAWRVGGRR